MLITKLISDLATDRDCCCMSYKQLLMSMIQHRKGWNELHFIFHHVYEVYISNVCDITS